MVKVILIRPSFISSSRMGFKSAYLIPMANQMVVKVLAASGEIFYKWQSLLDTKISSVQNPV